MNRPAELAYVYTALTSPPRAWQLPPKGFTFNSSCSPWEITVIEGEVRIITKSPEEPSLWTTRFFTQFDDWFETNTTLSKKALSPEGGPWLRLPKIADFFKLGGKALTPSNHKYLQYLIDVYEHRHNPEWLRQLGTLDMIRAFSKNITFAMYLVSQYSVTADPYSHFKRIQYFLSQEVMPPSELQHAFSWVIRTIELPTLWVTSTPLFWELCELLGWEAYRLLNLIETQCLLCVQQGHHPQYEQLVQEWFVEPLTRMRANMKKTFPHFLRQHIFAPPDTLQHVLAIEAQRQTVELSITISQLRPLVVLWICLKNFFPRISSSRQFERDDIKRFIRHFLYQTVYESKDYTPFHLAWLFTSCSLLPVLQSVPLLLRELTKISNRFIEEGMTVEIITMMCAPVEDVRGIVQQMTPRMMMIMLSYTEVVLRHKEGILEPLPTNKLQLRCPVQYTEDRFANSTSLASSLYGRTAPANHYGLFLPSFHRERLLKIETPIPALPQFHTAELHPFILSGLILQQYYSTHHNHQSIIADYIRHTAATPFTLQPPFMMTQDDINTQKPQLTPTPLNLYKYHQHVYGYLSQRQVADEFQLVDREWLKHRYILTHLEQLRDNSNVVLYRNAAKFHSYITSALHPHVATLQWYQWPQLSEAGYHYLENVERERCATNVGMFHAPSGAVHRIQNIDKDVYITSFSFSTSHPCAACGREYHRVCDRADALAASCNSSDSAESLRNKINIQRRCIEARLYFNHTCHMNIDHGHNSQIINRMLPLQKCQKLYDTVRLQNIPV